MIIDDLNLDIELDLTPAPKAAPVQDGAAALTRQQQEEDELSPDGDFVVTDPPPKSLKVAPVLPTEIDLALVSPEKREIILANAESVGIKVLNAHLVDEVKKDRGDHRALLMEFPENPPPEVTGMQPLFRVSKKDDLDILFVGLPCGPIFQDEIELAVKKKFIKSNDPAEVANKHFVVYVYMAIALPFGGDTEKMNSGWGLTIFNPKEVERIMPKALRVHLGIDLWFKLSGPRFDAIWYRVEEVFSDDEIETVIKRSKEVASLGWALLTSGAPQPEIPVQAIKRWEDEYYAKHPEKRPKKAEVALVPPGTQLVAEKRTTSASTSTVPAPAKGDLF